MPSSSRICRYAAVLILCLLAAAGRAESQNVSRTSLEERMRAVLVHREPALIAIRRDLHQHPELSGEEVRTAALVADRLRTLGFVVRSGVGGRGVVGLLRGGRPGPVVAFRADMDAVRSGDLDPVDYRSLTRGVRHICGHDVHTTLGLALAEAFQAVQQDLPGSLLLIFQPSEESATGARAMLADNVFSLARPVAVYAVHTAPLEVGRIGSEPGALFAGRDFVEVTLSGSGPLDEAADSVVALLGERATITAAEARGRVPGDFVLANVQPPRTLAGGNRIVRATLSIADSGTRARAPAAIRSGIGRIRFPGVATDLSYHERAIAGVTNDPALTLRGEARIRAILGNAAVVRTGVVSPLFSEDFGSFDEVAPVVMYLLGVSNAARGWVGMPHSPDYVADDAAIVIGARALAAVLLERMAAPP